jgi:hypothetical protein
VVAGAAVGSLAVDGGDRFSDLDLTFGIADHVPVADVLHDWTRTLVDELDAVHLADLKRGPTTYRVFLLPDALQFDLSMTPAAQFRPAGSRFRLLFGKQRPASSRFPHRRSREASSFPRRRSRGTSSRGASSTRSMRARASSAAVSGRRSIMSGPCATTRSRLLASAKGCPRCRRAATTNFQQRRWLDSRYLRDGGARRRGLRGMAPRAGFRAIGYSIEALAGRSSAARLRMRYASRVVEIISG